MRCNKCGSDLKRLMLLALLQDCGAHCSPGADKCTFDGGEHDFSDKKEPKEKDHAD
jgi:hypothetical protein